MLYFVVSGPISCPHKYPFMKFIITLLCSLVLLGNTKVFAQGHDVKCPGCRYYKKPSQRQPGESARGAYECICHDCSETMKKDNEVRNKLMQEKAERMKAEQDAKNKAWAAEQLRLEKEHDEKMAEKIRKAEEEKNKPVEIANSSVDTIVNEIINGDQFVPTYFRFNIPEGVKKLTVITTEKEGIWCRNRADLFVSKGVDPKFISWLPYKYTADCASINSNREDELCTFTNPEPGQWSVMLYDHNTFFISQLIAIIEK